LFGNEYPEDRTHSVSVSTLLCRGFDEIWD